MDKRPNLLDVRHLRMVEALCEHRSFTRAAEALGLTQSALSHSIRSLEERLSAQLFTRARNAVRPTAEGMRLLDLAQRINGMLTEAEADLQSLTRGQSGALRLSTACYTCYHWLPAVVSKFARSHPNIEIDLVLEATQAPVAAVLDGRLDVGITDEPIDDERLLTKDLFEDEIVALVPPSHPLSSRQQLDLSDFAGTHILVHDKAQNGFVNTTLRRARVRPRKISDIRGTEGIRELAKAGVGIAVMAKWAASSDVRSGALCAIPIGSGLHRSWRAVFAARKKHPAYVWDFLNVLATASFDERGLIPQSASGRRATAAP